MKVIFLDIDGVLNYTKWYVDDRNPGNLYGQEGDIDPLCVDRILRICRETGAKVVISSDWRYDWFGTRMRLGKMGLTDEFVIDKTPEYAINKLTASYFLDDIDGYEYSRGHEIDLWLNEHPECSNFTIIDDRTDFTEDQQPHFVHVDPMYGITDDNADIAIMILNHH